MTTDQEIEGNGEARFWAKTLSTILASIDSIIGKHGAIFPRLCNWLDHLVIAPSQQPNWWHIGRTRDGKPSMQFVTYWYVNNRMDMEIGAGGSFIALSQNKL